MTFEVWIPFNFSFPTNTIQYNGYVTLKASRTLFWTFPPEEQQP